MKNINSVQLYYKVENKDSDLFKRASEFLAIKISESSAAVCIIALAEVTARILVECPDAERITKAFCDDLMQNVKRNLNNNLKRKKNDTELH